MKKFSNVKVGDEIFLIGDGWCKVRLRHCSCFYLENEKGLPLQPAFDLDGRISGERTVVCYWKEVALPNKDEDVRPFDLIEYLRDNLEPKEFEQDTSNIELFFSHETNSWDWVSNIMLQSVGVIYFKASDRLLSYVVDTLNDNKVTIQQLKQAYKTLGWL